MFSLKWLLPFSVSVLLLLKLPLANTAPGSNCYVVDKNDYIYDFTNLVGKKFEYEGKESDLAVRFCNDVQHRSDSGYVDFGHFTPINYFAHGTGNTDFVQEYYFGDLQHCEHYGFDKMGRSAQVNIICGNCSNRATCRDESGCICNVSYDTSCRAIVELALSCSQPSSRVFQGFTIGFHPRAWELVYNGITQWGYEKPQYGYSFGTKETKVSLYFTAVAAVSKYVGKPSYTVFPDKGLEVELSGSASAGDPPTTLSPTILNVNWRCEKAQDALYIVNITVPIEGYPPISFSLGKLCEYKQARRSDSTKGWATFGIICCIFIVLSTASCCAGFLYKTRVEKQHGLYAVPGMTVLAACLEVASGGTNGGYIPANDASQSSWERPPVPHRVSEITTDSKYGSV